MCTYTSVYLCTCWPYCTEYIISMATDNLVECAVCLPGLSSTWLSSFLASSPGLLKPKSRLWIFQSCDLGLGTRLATSFPVMQFLSIRIHCSLSYVYRVLPCIPCNGIPSLKYHNNTSWLTYHDKGNAWCWLVHVVIAQSLSHQLTSILVTSDSRKRRMVDHTPPFLS